MSFTAKNWGHPNSVKLNGEDCGEQKVAYHKTDLFSLDSVLDSSDILT